MLSGTISFFSDEISAEVCPGGVVPGWRGEDGGELPEELKLCEMKGKRSPAAKSDCEQFCEQTPPHPGDAVHWRARLYTEHFLLYQTWEVGVSLSCPG